MGIVLLGFAALQRNTGRRILLTCLLIPLVLLLHEPSDRDHYSLWTPYQEINFTRIYASNGEMAGGLVRVNHIGYQFIVDLASDFLGRHPKALKEPVDENPYNVPFRFAEPEPAVMIVGSGTGNDVAAALRHNSSLIDAVEIDPAILEIGRKEHPEHPYDSPRVSVHLTDARAFLKRSTKKYGRCGGAGRNAVRAARRAGPAGDRRRDRQHRHPARVSRGRRLAGEYQTMA
jgi:hypothetical protein